MMDRNKLLGIVIFAALILGILIPYFNSEKTQLPKAIFEKNEIISLIPKFRVPLTPDSRFISFFKIMELNDSLVQDWSPIPDEMGVPFGLLSPGLYQFKVQFANIRRDSSEIQTISLIRVPTQMIEDVSFPSNRCDQLSIQIVDLTKNRNNPLMNLPLSDKFLEELKTVLNFNQSHFYLNDLEVGISEFKQLTPEKILVKLKLPKIPGPKTLRLSLQSSKYKSEDFLKGCP